MNDTQKALDLAQERFDHSKEWLMDTVEKSEEAKREHIQAYDEAHKVEILADLAEETRLDIWFKQKELEDWRGILDRKKAIISEKSVKNSNLITNPLRDEIGRLEIELDCLLLTKKCLEAERSKNLPKREKELLRLRKARSREFRNRSLLQQARLQYDHAESTWKRLNTELTDIKITLLKESSCGGRLSW